MAVLHFFCEFGIPWIWKWEPEIDYTKDNIPFLKRVCFIKFWKKMVRLNSEGAMEAQETINQIKEKIQKYEEQIALRQQREAYNPFKLLEGRILSPNMSKQEQFEELMNEAKKAILQRFSSDDEMIEQSKSQGNSTLFQDSQDPNDLDLEIDENMANFYAQMLPDKTYGRKTPSISSDSSSGPGTSDKQDTKAKSRGKKNKGKKR